MRLTRLARVARTISGSGFPPSAQGLTHGELPFVKVSDLARPQNAESVVDAANWVSAQVADELGARRIPPGSTIFPKVGAALLGNARGQSGVPHLLDNNMMAVAPVTIEPRYLYWWLQSVDMGELSEGGTLPFVSDTAVRDLRVPVLADDAQRRIADFLDDRVARIDQIITARRNQQQQSAAWFMAAVQQEFDDLAGIYGTGRLGYLLRGLEQGWSPQADASPADHGEWGVMRSGCVNDGVFRADDNKRLPDALKPQRRYEIEAGDLLMSRASGSLDKIGSVAVVPEGVRDKLLLCDKIYRLAPALGWSADYLAYMMGAHSNRELIRIGVSGAEGMANNLPSGVVRSLQIPLAPRAAQGAAAARVEDLREQRRALVQVITEAVDLLTEYKQSLITAAVTGELDVTTAGSGIPS